MPRRAPLLIVLIALAFSRTAYADKDVDDAKALLETLRTSASRDERVAAAAQLAEIGGRVVDTLKEFLLRTRESTLEERRAILKKIGASMPDKNGQFQKPGRESKEKIRADDAFDWMAAFLALEPMPGLGDVIADDAAIRALSASKKVEAAKVILDVTFTDDAMIYRDEGGRYLRKMSPYSVPALIVYANSKKNRIRQRYCNYQLERLDRQEPGRALKAAADDEDLVIAILEAYGTSEARDAVNAVAAMIDHEAPRVRAAARAAWLQYVQPPHPAAAPKKKLQMTGGQTTTQAKPLYLNSRELAQIETARIHEELFGEALANADEDEVVEAAVKRIYAHHDAQRAARDAAEIAAGRAKAESGDLAGAIAVFDRLIATDPQGAGRAEMAPVYMQHAEQLAADEKWADAAAMYSKAHGLAPEGEQATDALAAHYYALGKAEVAAGKDGSASFRKAVELRPDYAEAKEAEQAAAAELTPAKDKQWMLYVAAAVALGAIGLLAMGLVRKPARPR